MKTGNGIMTGHDTKCMPTIRRTLQLCNTSLCLLGIGQWSRRSSLELLAMLTRSTSRRQIHTALDADRHADNDSRGVLHAVYKCTCAWLMSDADRQTLCTPLLHTLLHTVLHTLLYTLLHRLLHTLLHTNMIAFCLTMLGLCWRRQKGANFTASKFHIQVYLGRYTWMLPDKHASVSG